MTLIPSTQTCSPCGCLNAVCSAGRCSVSFTISPVISRWISCANSRSFASVIKLLSTAASIFCLLKSMIMSHAATRYCKPRLDCWLNNWLSVAILSAWVDSVCHVRFALVSVDIRLWPYINLLYVETLQYPIGWQNNPRLASNYSYHLHQSCYPPC